jgi:hypothetical protein
MGLRCSDGKKWRDTDQSYYIESVKAALGASIAARILTPEPAKCGFDLLGAPTATEQHQCVFTENADFE